MAAFLRRMAIVMAREHRRRPVEFNAGGGSPEIIFSSDWSAATGTGDTAVRDGGIWDDKLCAFTDVANVIDGDAVGWTLSANCMEITRNASNCLQVEETPLDVAEGEDVYLRMYARADVTRANGNPANHPVCYNCSGAIQLMPWAPWVQEGTAAGKYQAKLATSTSAFNIEWDRRWKPSPDLDTGVWHRFEFWNEYIIDASPAWGVRVWPRVYNMAGTLIRDSDSYVRMDGFGAPDPTETLTEYYDGGGFMVVTDGALARNFGVGYEGPAGATNTGEHWYYGGVAVARGGWAGGI